MFSVPRQSTRSESLHIKSKNLLFWQATPDWFGNTIKFENNRFRSQKRSLTRSRQWSSRKTKKDSCSTKQERRELKVGIYQERLFRAVIAIRSTIWVKYRIQNFLVVILKGWIEAGKINFRNVLNKYNNVISVSK